MFLSFDGPYFEDFGVDEEILTEGKYRQRGLRDYREHEAGVKGLRIRCG